MRQLHYVNSFRDLLVYQKSRKLALRIFVCTKKFPREEIYALTGQIQRSSRSIGAQIAEAWAKRRYEKHFLSKLTDADGEQQETQHWLDITVDCQYLTKEEAADLLADCEEIGRLSGGMMAKAKVFCQPKTLKEPHSEYFINCQKSEY